MGRPLRLLFFQLTGVEVRHRGWYGREGLLQELGLGQLTLVGIAAERLCPPH